MALVGYDGFGLLRWLWLVMMALVGYDGFGWL
jgi:hypothetical protein